jgi:hypothetical protein
LVDETKFDPSFGFDHERLLRTIMHLNDLSQTKYFSKEGFAFCANAPVRAIN